MKGEFRSKGPELLVDMAQHVSSALTELLGIESDKAEHVGQ